MRLDKGKYSLHAFHPHLVVAKPVPGEHAMGSWAVKSDMLRVTCFETATISFSQRHHSCHPLMVHWRDVKPQDYPCAISCP